jgi:thiamine pyrophosphokinase
VRPTIEAGAVKLRGLPREGRVTGAVLALNGASGSDLERTAALLEALAERPLLVAVDGGLASCRQLGLVPQLLVGDGDSIDVAVPEGLPAVPYPADKDFSDLCGALREASRREIQVVGVAGMLGGRLDHEWANLFELTNWAGSFAAILSCGVRGTVLITRHGFRAATREGRVVSTFPIAGAAEVTLRGARWPLDRATLRPGSHGLSNETGSEFDLVVHDGVVVVVFPE